LSCFTGYFFGLPSLGMSGAGPFSGPAALNGDSLETNHLGSNAQQGVEPQHGLFFYFGNITGRLS
jgi:hypothetical protein